MAGWISQQPSENNTILILPSSLHRKCHRSVTANFAHWRRDHDGQTQNNAKGGSQWYFYLRVCSIVLSPHGPALAEDGAIWGNTLPTDSPSTAACLQYWFPAHPFRCDMHCIPTMIYGLTLCPSMDSTIGSAVVAAIRKNRSSKLPPLLRLVNITSKGFPYTCRKLNDVARTFFNAPST